MSKDMQSSNDKKPGEESEFIAFLEGSMEELRMRTASHQSVWRLGHEERWDLHQEVGDLVFTFQDMIVKAPAQIIGSIDTTTNMWLWAWANPSIAEPLTKDASRVLEYGKQHNISRLTTPQWQAEEVDGWYMAALATRLCAASGAYRGPVGTFLVFMTFGETQLTRR